MENFTTILILIIAALIVCVIVLVVNHQKSAEKLAEANAKSSDMGIKLARHESATASLNEKINERDKTIANQSAQITKLTSELRNQENTIATLRAQIDNANKANEQMRKQQAENNENAKNAFKAIAEDLLRKNSNEFKIASAEKISEIMRPFKENVDNMQKSIKDYYDSGLKETSSLKEIINQLSDSNKRLNKEAEELSKALRGNHKNSQGPWGEMILKQILENSGLQEGINFSTQATHNQDGSSIDCNYRPDALLFMPDKKVLIIDSKVNITAYTGFVNADNEEEKTKFLKDHIAAVKTQISHLSDKEYHKAVKNSAEFVIMFVPNEGAYMAAMQGDPELWSYAYSRQVVLVSPTHLISMVKLMEQLWRTEKQNKNAIEIARQAGSLIDKLSGFVADMDKVNKGIEAARKAYDEANKKLRFGQGNLLGRAKAMKDLGAKVSKEIPEHEDSNLIESPAEKA